MNIKIKRIHVYSIVVLALILSCIAWYTNNHGETVAINSVELVTGDVEWIMDSALLESYKNKAMAGDARAAESVANHYAELGNKPEQQNWLTVAAAAGSCNAMGLLKELAVDREDRSAVSHWNVQMGNRGCPTFD